MEQTQKSKLERRLRCGREGRPLHWTNIGASWPHSDDKGFNIILSAMPLNGRPTIHKPKTERDDASCARSATPSCMALHNLDAAPAELAR